MLNSKPPVIIGSSLTGLLISRTLDMANIDHILIGGDEPEDKPRLGESMHELAGSELWRWLGPEFHKYFHAKNHLCMLNGPFIAFQQIRNPNLPLEQTIFEGAKVNPATQTLGLITVDRSQLDGALYRQIRASDHCTFIYDLAAQLIYDEQTDTISRIQLSNGETIDNPRYVFDATGPAGVVARAIGVEKELLGKPKRLVWTHHYQTESAAPTAHPKVWWRYGSTTLKMIEAIDGVSGPVWLIPLPDRISIGLSTDAAKYPPEVNDDERLIQLIDEAFARRGIDYLSHYPETKPVQGLNYHHFIRERAYGRNWLLPGIAFMQTWFPIQLGVAASTLAARLAPKLVTNPEEMGRLYQDILRSHLNVHHLLDTMIEGPPFTEGRQVRSFFRHWGYSHNLKIMIDGMRIVNDDLDSKAWYYQGADFGAKFSASSDEFAQLFFEATPLLGAGGIEVYEPDSLSDLGKALDAYFTDVPLFLRYSHTKWYDIIGQFWAQDWQQLKNVRLSDLRISNQESPVKVEPDTLASPAPLATKPKTPLEPLVAVQPNGTKRPFFCLAAGHTDVPLLANLADSLGPNQPYYVLRLPSSQKPPLEALAATYIELIRTIQADGAYQLGGFNIGGIVAFEMAQQLLASGAEVSSLALLDTPYPAGNTLPGWGFRQTNKTSQGIQKLFKAGPGRAIALTSQGVWDTLAPRLPKPIKNLRDDYKTFIGALTDEAYEANLCLTQTYTPQAYSGRTLFLTATASPYRYAEALWRRHTVAPNTLQTHLVSGNSSSMLRMPHVQALTDKLKQFLD